MGDVEKGFAEADVIVEQEFTTATVHQGYIEPHNATAFWNADGQLTVWTSTQGAFEVRQQLYDILHYSTDGNCYEFVDLLKVVLQNDNIKLLLIDECVQYSKNHVSLE